MGKLVASGAVAAALAFCAGSAFAQGGAAYSTGGYGGSYGGEGDLMLGHGGNLQLQELIDSYFSPQSFPQFDPESPDQPMPDAGFPPAPGIMGGLNPSVIGPGGLGGIDPYIMPAGPEATPGMLMASNLYRGSSGRCALDPVRFGLDCEVAGLITASNNRLLAGSAANPGCKDAVPAMVQAYPGANPTPEVAGRYDLACLGALALRADGSRDARPPVLADAELEGGLLSSIGIVFDARDIPACAGLLTPEGHFITARHCDPFLVPGTMVHQASSGLAWTASRVAVGTVLGVPGDWSVYALGGAELPQARAVTLAPPRSGEPVTLLAAYPHLGVMPDAGSPLTEAMRFPRPGLCEAVYVDADCVQMICQTIKGFSGAPIFRASSSPDAPEVIGFVSGSEGEDARCSFSKLDQSTLAVSSQNIRGIR